jgi:hypothetical protein
MTMLVVRWNVAFELAAARLCRLEAVILKANFEPPFLEPFPELSVGAR